MDEGRVRKRLAYKVKEGLAGAREGLKGKETEEKGAGTGREENVALVVRG